MVFCGVLIGLRTSVGNCGVDQDCEILSKIGEKLEEQQLAFERVNLRGNK